MEELVQINFVYSKDMSKIKSFLDNIPKCAESINYISIYDKLAKNDYYDYKPSDAVVSTFLIREIQQAFVKSINEIYYVIESSKYQNVLDIQNFIKSLSHKEIVFNMYYSENLSYFELNELNDLFKDLIKF